MKILKQFTTYLLLCCLIIVTGCSNTSGSNQKIELTISAAASLMDSLLEIKENFIIDNPEVNIEFNFGGSGTLRKQIEQGADIDLFFSASETDHSLLEEFDFIENGSILFQNKLVFVTLQQSEMDTFDAFLQTNKKMAIGTPDSVPAGSYAKEVLKELAVWEQLQERIVYTNSVSQVVTYVEEGAVEVGIVYGSDALTSKKIKILEEIDPILHTPILYYVGTIKNGKKQMGQKKEYVEKFYDYVLSEESMDIFKRHGFQINEEEAGE